MPRYHFTKDGNVPFTAEEEAEWDARDLAWESGADERAAEQARKERDVLISKTDWRSASDLTLSAEWAAYRQALRDVPQQEGFPNSINWPTEPE